MKHYSGSGSDSGSDNESGVLNSSNTTHNDDESSDDESRNTSHTKSSDCNDSRPIDSDNDNSRVNDDDSDNESNKNNSDNESGSDSSASGSGSGSGGSDDSDSDAGSDSGDNKSDSDKSADGESDDDRRQESNDSDDGSSSSNSDDERRHKNSGKEKPAWEQNPDMYGVRRSGRDRKQPERMSVEHQELNKKISRKRHHSSGSSYSDSDDSTSHQSKKITKVVRRMSYEERIAKRSARHGSNHVSYKESESDGSDEEDSAGSEGAENVRPKDRESDENTQTIEKIIDHRIGKKGAVGMQTYIYEVEKKGDPNSNYDPNDPTQVEKQFLVKWKDWAHVHNTWESEESLKTQKVKGLKKLENYLRKEDDINLWKNRATPEEVEYMEIQSELEKDLCHSHLKADRIFAEAEENGNNFFYVKWVGLPYSESTWEGEAFVRERYPDKVKEFEERERSTCTPRQCPALKHRPKFSHIKDQPSYLGGSNDHLELRDYQMQGLNWLVHAWCKHNSVILADEMGLGKTIQAISFVSYLFHSHSMYGPYIFVLPLSTLNAWEREFSLWAPDINVIVYIGDRDSRKIIRDYEWSFSSKRLKFNVVLTTYEILLRDKDELKECSWSAMIIDEAHRLKNEESQLYLALMEFRSNHRVLITGTPLQNSLKELWALLHFIMPDKFDDWSVFESQHDAEKMEKGFHKLHKQLEPFLLRRVKKDVEKSLPSKVEQILRVDMTKEQKQYYKWILTKNYEALRKGNRGSTSTFVNIVMELKKCCNHSFLTKPPDEYPTNPTEILQQLLRGSGKLVLLDKLLMRLHETGHRVLIFSQMVRQLDILSQYLQMRRLPFQRLDGSIRGELRKQALDHFNAEGSQDFCFLLSTRAGGLGINLATADTVVIFDSDWNPQNDLQAQARAHRIGQKNQVNIYRLVTKNSIEENIIERAKQKMVLDHLVIQSMDTSGRTVFNKKMNSNSNPFNKEELNAILKFGADELFKDDDDETEEPACDIDEILRRAETREDGPASAGDDLLSAFKVASINIDEDEEVSRLDSAADENTKDWDDIIPESYVKEIKETEKAKEMADLYLPPRSRKTVNSSQADSKAKESDSSSDEGSDKDDESPKKKAGRPKGSASKEKETVKGFSEPEVRRFFKSMKKFSNPVRRLDTISRDADLREKPIADLKRLAEIILERCREFMAEASANPNRDQGPPRRGKPGGNSFKLSGVSINAKTTLAALDELAPLDTIVPHAPVERARWVLPIKKVKDTHWDTIWSIQDDSRLLCGIYEYGMGAWEQIKADPALNLGDKILLEGDVKPQAKQLESRVQYLLKFIKKHGGFNQGKPVRPKPKQPRVPPAASRAVKAPKGITPEIVDDDSTDDEKPSSIGSSTSNHHQPKRHSPLNQDKEVKENIKEHHADVKGKTKVKERSVEKEVEAKEDSVKEESRAKKKKEKKKEKKPKDKITGPVHITGNGVPLPILDDAEMDVNHPMWSQCKEKMRPMKKHLVRLSNGGGDNVSQEEQIAITKNCLLTIGDHIYNTIASETPENLETWKVLLWRFVSKFTEYDAKKLHKFYKKTKKQEMEKESSSAKTVEEKPDKEQKTEAKSEKREASQSSSKDRKRYDRHDQHNSYKRPHDSQDQPPSKKSFNGSDSNHREDYNADRDRKRDRDNRRDRDSHPRDRSRDRDRSNDSRGYNRHHSRNRDNWHQHKRQEGGRYSGGGYHRDGGGYNNSGYNGGGYQRGGDWRGGGPGRPRPPKHSNYSSPVPPVAGGAGGYGPPPPAPPAAFHAGPGGFPPPPGPPPPSSLLGAPPPMYGGSPQGGGGGGYSSHYRGSGGDWIPPPHHNKDGGDGGSWSKDRDPRGRGGNDDGGGRGGYNSVPAQSIHGTTNNSNV